MGRKCVAHLEIRHSAKTSKKANLANVPVVLRIAIL